MPLRSKEPPERPLAPMDLSHCNLICICHRPLIGHLCFPTLHTFHPSALSSPQYPSHTLKTVARPDHPKPARPTSNCQAGQPRHAPTRSIDIVLGRSRPLWTD